LLRIWAIYVVFRVHSATFTLGIRLCSLPIFKSQLIHAAKACLLFAIPAIFKRHPCISTFLRLLTQGHLGSVAIIRHAITLALIA
jgi:hypothetical protein